MRKLTHLGLMMLLLWAGVVAAQDANIGAENLVSPMNLLPAQYDLEGFRYEAQGWNNCGPATLTMGLTFFGYEQNQNAAALWLKPDPEDKNVSPWQMAAFVNTQVPGTTRALVRHGGDVMRLKTLVANEFPVIIEAGYDPPPHDLGWMGHYLLVKGYNDNSQQFITHDSYDGANYPYAYTEIEDKWRHFNNLYIVLYDISREQELFALLGDDADPTVNIQNALAKSQREATADWQDGVVNDPWAWFNLGTNYVMLEQYPQAAVAYDQAFSGGLPWRMLWYQFGPFEAYNAVGRYGDTIRLAQTNLNDGGGQFVEETYYYAGVAREGMGEIERAISNYNSALAFNANFTPAREARDRLQNNG